MGQLPVELKIAAELLNFLLLIRKSENIILRVLSTMDYDFTTICSKYSIKGDAKYMYVRVETDLWSYFQDVMLLN